MKITFDSNCLIALEGDEAVAAALRQLIDLHSAGRIQIAVPAIAASERKRPGQDRWPPFEVFRNRLDCVGLTTAELLRPMLYWGVSYLDWGLSFKEEQLPLERDIHSVLFEGIPFQYTDFCAAAGMPFEPTVPDGKWLNAKCDVQSMWCHIRAGNDVFVTSDKNFHKATKRPQLIALGAGEILKPDATLRHVAVSRSL